MLAELFFPAEQIPSSTLSYRVQTIYWTTRYGLKSKFFLNLSPKNLLVTYWWCPQPKSWSQELCDFCTFSDAEAWYEVGFPLVSRNGDTETQKINPINHKSGTGCDGEQF